MKMLQCPNYEAFVRLFYNLSTSLFLLFIFFHFTSIFLAKILIFFGGNPFYQRSEDGYEYNAFSDEEMEEENDVYVDHAKAVEEEGRASHVVRGWEDRAAMRDTYECSNEESVNESLETSEATSYSTPGVESSGDDEEEGVGEEEIVARDTDSSYGSEPNEVEPTSRFGTSMRRNILESNNEGHQDSDDEKREEGLSSSRIPSTSFLLIMEESIRTFMTFLKQDKKSNYQILADLFRRNRRGSADATLLLLLKKVNKKKKAKLNDLRRSGRCLRKRKLRDEEELEILMAQIDLKVVSRVLRMADLNGEQLHWCENKMSKVRVSDGKLQRDSSPLFFPAH
ncbi:UNVERIFIED_CONTAM: hypothetical protein Sangu_2039000 [Sesamum angustifolium]|uniref:Uncharacterized protein n=1 Tax=Sesamum angustifolium TaxID=2727405 RepID=A0AAW2LIR4_9LAMI